jgi:hypothetical protein
MLNNAGEKHTSMVGFAFCCPLVFCIRSIIYFPFL